MQDAKLHGRSDESNDTEIITLDRAAYNQGKNAKYDFSIIEGGGRTYTRCKRSWCSLLQKTVGALCATDYKFPQQQQIEQGKVVIEMGDTEYIVRRLTPL